MELLDRAKAYFSQTAAPRWKVVDGEIVAGPEADVAAPDKLDRLGQRPGIRRGAGAKTTPTILPFADLLHHPKFPKDGLIKGLVPVGLTKNSGDLLMSSWQRMTTGIVAGRRNHGKSGILKSFILYALHARKQGLNCQIWLFDPHHNLPDATGTFFKPILHQFDQAFLGMDSLRTGRHLEFLHGLLDYVQACQKTGFDDAAPWYFIFVDEADLLFQDEAYGKENYRLIRDLINLRKGRIFFMLSFADTTKSGSGGKGTGLVAAGTTVFVVNYDMTRARLVLQGTDEARKALNLPVGFAAVKIPDAKVQVCRMPLVSEADLQPFL